MIELTLPAGSFESALQAFKWGADAIYLGLTSFSARKGAKNFTVEELANIKEIAASLDKKIYVTINTLLEDGELKQLPPILRTLDLLQIDGVIVQDLGLASYMHENFPTLPIHASTQLAVHTVSGVKQLEALGFSRVVLSRELTLDEIKSIRKECPEISIKVFIHGALCYGFSGLCMASSNLTSRSANKGECSQICRSYFSNETTSSLYPFSMKDLASSRETIQTLQEIGIDSLKIEGRMKSPEYVAASANYYRLLIDGVGDEKVLKEAKEHLDTTFSREQSGGWLAAYDKKNPSDIRTTPSLITTTYSEHQGVPVGTIFPSQYDDDMIYEAQFSTSVAVHDGILVLRERKDAISVPIRFSLMNMWDRNMRKILSAGANQPVFIELPQKVNFEQSAQMYRIKEHDGTLAKEEKGGYQPFRYPIEVSVTIDEDSFTLSTTHLPSWINEPSEQKFPIDIQEAKKPQRVNENIDKIFKQGDSPYIVASKVLISHAQGKEISSLFIPLSAIKEIRRIYYKQLDQLILTEIEKPMNEKTLGEKRGVVLPKRALLSPPNSRNLPFVNLTHTLKKLQQGSSINELLAIVDDTIYLPLPPISFNEEEDITAFKEILNLLKQPVIIGINNISHLSWVADKPSFIDVYFYIANKGSAHLVSSLLPQCVGGYYWIEHEMKDTRDYPLVMSQVEKEFTLPMFLSRSCYRYDVLGLSCENCSRNDSYTVEQRDNTYSVDIHNCLTVVSKQ
jgi:putative protease